jgi:hypothetical protein
MTEPISFEGDIKPLFRERDQRSMQRHFDLWSYDDVKAHADDILDAVSTGSMPCDDEWPAEKVDTFRSWMDSDFPA